MEIVNCMQYAVSVKTESGEVLRFNPQISLNSEIKEHDPQTIELSNGDKCLLYGRNSFKFGQLPDPKPGVLYLVSIVDASHIKTIAPHRDDFVTVAQTGMVMGPDKRPAHATGFVRISEVASMQMP